jgi:large subunit ribosomal protein L3
VFPGKKMSGQMGNVTKTVQNLIVARVDTERGLLLVRGAVPGSKGGDVVVTPAVKMRLNPIKAAPVAKPEDAKAAKAAAARPGAKPAAKPAGKAKG